MVITIEVVESEKQFHEWYAIFCSVFTDAEDHFSEPTILDIIAERRETSHHLLIIRFHKKPVGMIWQMINNRIRICYYYYFGVLEGYRNKGVFSFFQEHNEECLKSGGIELIIAEPKNPRCFKRDYEINEAKSRLRFYLDRLHFSIVSDLEITYLRHYPPDVLDRIQDYYLLSFKPLTESKKNQLLFNGKLTKEGLKSLYLGLMYLELGMPEEELRSQSAAANMFLRTLAIAPVEGFSLLSLKNEIFS